MLDLQGLPALKLDARGAWARKGAPILSVLSITTGAPDPRDPAWLRAGGGNSLRFHYPGTHGEVLHRWRVPLRVDGREVAIQGAVERVARPPLAWAIGAAVAVAAGAGLVLALSRAAAHGLRPRSAALAAVAVVAPLRRERGRPRRGRRAPSSLRSSRSPASGSRSGCGATRRSSWGAGRAPPILLVLPLVGRLAVLRHGVIVTTLAPDLERALVVGGLALAAAAIAAAARAWWPVVS